MRRLGILLLLLLAILIGLPLGAVVALNSQAGRDFAVAQLNRHSGGQIIVSGLGGHFPADLKLASLTIADRQGVWLTGSDLELRWRPDQLLLRKVNITSLTAARLAIARAPAPQNQAKTATPLNLHHFTATLDRLAIGQFDLGAALAGRPISLAVHGSGQLVGLTQGSVNLNAIAANQGSYQLAAVIDKRNVETTLHIAEPPEGLLGHYAGQAHAPLRLDLRLAGPRNAAALNFSAALGEARMDGAGTLGLDPRSPHADIVFTLPSLAAGPLAAQKLGGAARLHLLAAQSGKATNLTLDGDVALTAPEPAARLVGRGHLALALRLANNAAEIQSLGITGAAFNATASGAISQSGLDLQTHFAIDQVADLSPAISGKVTGDDVITGAWRDFAVHAVLGGTIRQRVPSGPFTLTLEARHLPDRPSGTLAGTGQLENATLLLDAAFSRDAAGAELHIASATWRSIRARADLALAAGAQLPTGTASFAIHRLADLAAFSPVPISGSVQGDFAHRNAQDFGLNLTADNLEISPAFGVITAQLGVEGPIARLAVRLNASLPKLAGAPLRLSTAGTVDGDARSASISSLTANWKTLNIGLLGPAGIATRPALAIHHLALGVNGGTLTLDGILAPRLDFTLGIRSLPADLAELAAPGLAAPGLAVTGTLSADARIRGSKTAPSGSITLAANRIGLPGAAALPPANLAAQIKLSGSSAGLSASLEAGPAQLTAAGQVPLSRIGPMNITVSGLANLQMLDPVLAAQGTTIGGILTPDFTITGTPQAPNANGTLGLANGSVQNIGSGLNLLDISAHLAAADRRVTLQDFTATAGAGSITGHGAVDLGQPNMPIELSIDAANATPVASDLVTETLDAALNLNGALKSAMGLSGDIEILKANINIPRSLPASVADLPIYRPGETPPPPPAPPPKLALNLLIHAHNQMFIRGDGLFAELGGRLTLTGTAADPVPGGGFTLIRGSFALGGKTLQFTKGVVSFNGAGFMPTLDLEATTTTSNATATLVIGGTAADPTITLTSSPPLPSDEILSQLLFGQSTQTLSPFQAASLAAALASLSGIGGSAISDPLGGVRNALGLDELSLGGQSGAPSLQAGRYVAPGVFVGATQSTAGGTQATVQIDLYKGLKLQTQTGASSTGSGNASSVGLTYQFNY